MDQSSGGGVTGGPARAELDIWSLAAVIWARRSLVIVMAILVVGAAAMLLSTLTPRYTSQAKVLIENRESRFARPDATPQDQTFLSDQAAVQSEVQVLLSRDLAGKVAKSLNLADIGEFNANPRSASFIHRALRSVGLASDEVDDATIERVANTYFDRLTVYQVGTSRVIAVEFSSADPVLAARVVNTLSDQYIDVLRAAKSDSNQEAIVWLEGQIKEMRDKVAEAEGAVAAFRAESGLYDGTRDISLGRQQLAELNTQLIQASAQRSQAEARAELANRLLNDDGGIEAAADVLNSQLIQRLREQQAAVSRERAELSATLMSGHPRMRQLTAELRDLERRIAAEARKIARGLENEAEVAGAREQAIRDSLAKLKTEAGDVSQAEVKLRALEREAAAQRETLESFLRRFREASARQDVDAQPANARIISRATVATRPSFPPRGPILALAGVAGVLLGLVAAFFAEMIARSRAGGAEQPVEAAARTVASPEPVLSPPQPQSPPLAPAAATADTGQDDYPDLQLGGVHSDSSEAALAASCRPIARRLSLLRQRRGIRQVALLSLADDGEQSATAEYLCAALAEAGERVVLVEASGGPSAIGLRDLLRGASALGEVLRRGAIGQVARIASGTVAQDDERLLASERPKLVLDALMTAYDTAVVVAGGMQESEASKALAARCDLTLLLVSAEQLKGSEIRSAIDTLRAAGVTQAAILSRGADALMLYDAVAVRGPADQAA